MIKILSSQLAYCWEMETRRKGEEEDWKNNEKKKRDEEITAPLSSSSFTADYLHVYPPCAM